MGARSRLVALDLWSIERLYWQFSPPASQLFASDPIIEYLKAVKEPGRVLALQLSPQTDAQRDPYLSTESNGLMVHGIRQVVGYHGNSIGRYRRLDRGSDGSSSRRSGISSTCSTCSRTPTPFRSKACGDSPVP